MTDEEKIELKKKDAERKREWRKNQKDPEDDENSNQTFASPQVKGKLMKKVRKSLTGSEEQNKQILAELLDECGEVSGENRSNGRELPSETKELVTNFFLSNEISRISPNTSDVISVESEGEIVQLVKRHLLYSLKECFAIFRDEHREVNIGMTSFRDLKPNNVFSFTKLPHNVCVCEKHENMRLALKPLSKFHPAFADLYTDNKMHLNFVCPVPTQDCFENRCENCKNCSKMKEKSLAVENKSDILTWSKWIKSSEASGSKTLYCNIEKIQKKNSVEEILSDIYAQSSEFLDHEFVKLNQAEAYRKMVEDSSREDSDLAVVCCDFAEKFKCTQQNEPQSAHYGQTPVTLFTIAVYHRGVRSMVFACDTEKQTKDIVLAFVEKILRLLPETAKKVHFWSDNATSQFKNQFILGAMKKFKILHSNLEIHWNFYAPMHGKSIVDGIGATAKQFVLRKIIAQEILVKSAADFAAAASGIKIDVQHVSQEEVERLNIFINFDQIVKESKKITDIKKKHYFALHHELKGSETISKIIAEKLTPKV